MAQNSVIGFGLITGLKRASPNEAHASCPFFGVFIMHVPASWMCAPACPSRQLPPYNCSNTKYSHRRNGKFDDYGRRHHPLLRKHLERRFQAFQVPTPGMRDMSPTSICICGLLL